MARIQTASGLNAAHAAYVETRGRASDWTRWRLRRRLRRLSDATDAVDLAARKAIREELELRAR